MRDLWQFFLDIYTKKHMRTVVSELWFLHLFYTKITKRKEKRTKEDTWLLHILYTKKQRKDTHETWPTLPAWMPGPVGRPRLRFTRPKRAARSHFGVRFGTVLGLVEEGMRIGGRWAPNFFRHGHICWSKLRWSSETPKAFKGSRESLDSCPACSTSSFKSPVLPLVGCGWTCFLGLMIPQ